MERDPNTHWMGGLVGSIVGLHMVSLWKIHVPVGNWTLSIESVSSYFMVELSIYIWFWLSQSLCDSGIETYGIFQDELKYLQLKGN